MVKNIIQIDGMACSMCEAHVGDAIRKQFPNSMQPATTTRASARSLTRKRDSLVSLAESEKRSARPGLPGGRFFWAYTGAVPR